MHHSNQFLFHSLLKNLKKKCLMGKSFKVQLQLQKLITCLRAKKWRTSIYINAKVIRRKLIESYFSGFLYSLQFIGFVLAKLSQKAWLIASVIILSICKYFDLWTFVFSWCTLLFSIYADLSKVDCLLGAFKFFLGNFNSFILFSGLPDALNFLQKKKG